jgi:hypothetical protein
LAFGVVGTHFQQAVYYAKPVSGGSTDAADKLAGLCLTNAQIVHCTLPLFWAKQAKPRDGIQLGLRERASALVQRIV